MKTAKQLHKNWLKDSTYKSAYEALEDEFEVSRVLIKARAEANLTQSETSGALGEPCLNKQLSAS